MHLASNIAKYHINRFNIQKQYLEKNKLESPFNKYNYSIALLACVTHCDQFHGLHMSCCCNVWGMMRSCLCIQLLRRASEALIRSICVFSHFINSCVCVCVLRSDCSHQSACADVMGAFAFFYGLSSLICGGDQLAEQSALPLLCERNCAHKAPVAW